MLHLLTNDHGEWTMVLQFLQAFGPMLTTRGAQWAKAVWG